MPMIILLMAMARTAAGQEISGPLERGSAINVAFDGPQTAESADPNPFRDVRFDVTFTHEATGRTAGVPAYFAADGRAAETGASAGSTWRVHFVPPDTGRWIYRTSVRIGRDIALTDDPSAGSAVPADGVTGAFTIGLQDRSRRGFVGKGILRHHPGERYLRFDDGTYFVKGGADSPENFLAYADFDNTYSLKLAGTEQEGEARTAPLHRYERHERDWRQGDPGWRGGRGKGIIGALNYLASKGMNSVYFLTMNVEGDGDDVWPWVDPEVRDRFDVSKLDQWNTVFDHMGRLGLMMHVVLTETENETLFERYADSPTNFADERKLYYRELVARFGHHPALVWNLGEENGWDDRYKESTGESGAPNSDEQRKAFASFLRALDPYDHPIVVHTFPGDHEKIYRPLLGFDSVDGPSLQVGNLRQAHEATLKWVEASADSGHPWFVSVDEIGPAHTGVTADGPDSNHDTVRRHVLWGNLMAGGAGVEWYFGYDSPHNDLNAEDWRSRDAMWEYTRHALSFFEDHLPFWEMNADDDLISMEDAFVLARPGEVYAAYLPYGVIGSSEDEAPSSEATPTRLHLQPGTYEVAWFDPRAGGMLQNGSVRHVSGPGWQEVGGPSAAQGEDWIVLLRRME